MNPRRLFPFQKLAAAQFVSFTAVPVNPRYAYTLSGPAGGCPEAFSGPSPRMLSDMQAVLLSPSVTSANRSFLTPWNMPSVFNGEPNGAPPFVVPVPRHAA